MKLQENLKKCLSRTFGNFWPKCKNYNPATQSSSTGFTSKEFEAHLPKYLTPQDHAELLTELKNFHHNPKPRYYTNRLNQNKVVYQGDGFQNIPMISLETSQSRQIKGFLISNTCDASSENTRPYQSYFTFAPIFDLEKYKQALLQNHNPESVNDHVEAIKRQEVTNMFFLPARGASLGDCIVRLDCLFSFPITLISTEDLCNNRLLSLSDFGFYLLVFKLSVHFSRVQEGVSRGVS